MYQSLETYIPPITPQRMKASNARRRADSESIAIANHAIASADPALEVHPSASNLCPEETLDDGPKTADGTMPTANLAIVSADSAPEVHPSANTLCQEGALDDGPKTADGTMPTALII